MPGEEVRAGDRRVEDEGCDGPRDEVEYHPALVSAADILMRDRKKLWECGERLVRTNQRN